MKKSILLWTILLLPYLGMLLIWQYHKNEIEKIENSSFIVISKQDMTLSIYDYKGKMLEKFPIACGKNLGDKDKIGDMKTPEGVFHVSEIQNAENWSHDFKDGNGEIKGAYGSYFIRLFVSGQNGIGIHGTHDNNSLGNRITEGCIRLQNENLLKLVKLIHPGTVVVITPSTEDLNINEEIDD